MKTIKDLDIVALTEDLEATHFETKQIKNPIEELGNRNNSRSTVY